jgi:hypothetical protein
MMLVIGMIAVMALPSAAQETLKTAVDGTFAPHAMPKMSGGIEGFNADLDRTLQQISAIVYGRLYGIFS